MITIALDAMGGDRAPKEIIKGVFLALKTHNIRIMLVGQQAKIQKYLSLYQTSPHRDSVEVINADEVIEMGESPTQAFRKKKNSSIHVGLTLVKEKKADAFISAGNTGAVMAAATLILGRVKNIDRPAIASLFPTEKSYTLLLDLGATMDAKPQHLVQFALMGKCFSSLVLGVKDPTIALLNVGEESEKGNQQTQATFSLLQEQEPAFIGNIEGGDILSGKADVIVCDGFIGNTLLKFGESVVSLFMKFFKEEHQQSILSKIGLLFLYPAFKRFKKDHDYQEIGGAPLLGVDGVTIISHGKSEDRAIKSAISRAVQCVEANIVEKIGRAVTE